MDIWEPLYCLIKTDWLRIKAYNVDLLSSSSWRIERPISLFMERIRKAVKHGAAADMHASGIWSEKNYFHHFHNFHNCYHHQHHLDNWEIKKGRMLAQRWNVCNWQVPSEGKSGIICQIIQSSCTAGKFYFGTLEFDFAPPLILKLFDPMVCLSQLGH